MLPWQRPPVSDQTQGAQSNRPNSTSTLARCDHVAAYASGRLKWVNYFNPKSIDHGGANFLLLIRPKGRIEVPLVDTGQIAIVPFRVYRR